jgi:hypothetical protein
MAILRTAEELAEVEAVIAESRRTAKRHIAIVEAQA